MDVQRSVKPRLFGALWFDSTAGHRKRSSVVLRSGVIERVHAPVHASAVLRAQGRGDQAARREVCRVWITPRVAVRPRRPAREDLHHRQDLGGVSAARFERELKKCQLLCRRCHTKKLLKDAGLKPARGTHGTLSAVRYCDCARCRGAKNAYERDRRRKMRRRLKRAAERERAAVV